MPTYSVYHLEHTNTEYRDQIKTLTSTIPKLDETIIQLYCATRRHELQIRDSYKKITNDEFIKSKCEIVKQLLNTTAYRLVADVKTDNIVEVIKETNSINGYWFMKRNKKVLMKALSERDTRSYDVIMDGSNIYLINGVGFIDVNNECIFKVKS